MNWLLENTLIAAILATGVALGCRVWRASPVIRHALWLVVLIRLIAPPIFTVSLPFPAEWHGLGERGGVTTADLGTTQDSPLVSSLTLDSPVVQSSGPSADEGFETASSDDLPDLPQVDPESPAVPEVPRSEDRLTDSAFPNKFSSSTEKLPIK